MCSPSLAAAVTALLLVGAASDSFAAPADPAAAATPEAGAKNRKKAAPAGADKAAAAKAAKPAKPASGGKPGKPGKPGKKPATAVNPPDPTGTPTPSIPEAAAEPEAAYAGPADDDPPVLTHAPITKALRGKPLVFSAGIADASGVFQPLLYLRKKGTLDYIPIKLVPSKTLAGTFSVEVDARLVSVDLEYYLDCWDLAGNGPARAGTPESPFTILLEEPAKPAPAPERAPEKAPEVRRPPGAPPAIAHTTVTRTPMGQSLEIAARLVGDTGVSKPTVYFRRLGDKDYFELPMGNLGGDSYTATIPASQVTADLEYYLEASDRYGNGPGRSGGPNVPYFVTVEEKAEPEPGAAFAASPPPGPATTSTDAQVAGTGTPAQPEPGPEASGPAQTATSTEPAQAEPGPAPSGTSTEPEPAGSARPAAAQPTAAFSSARSAKPGYRANVGRWVGYLAMGGFLGGLVVAGGEAFGAWQAGDTYDATRSQYYAADRSPAEKLFYRPGVLQALASRSQSYAQRARVAGIVSGASLVVGIAMLLIFPSFPANSLSSELPDPLGGPRADAAVQPLQGSGGDAGDLVLARF